MSGIYIHIPFCRQRCHYCDFYSTTQLKRKPELVSALIQELKLREKWLCGEEIKSLYFGGGTPSLLSSGEINTIIETIYKSYNVTDSPEITLEANPDDLSKKQIELIKATPVNRLSIGIQSFHNHELEIMSRRHNAEQVYTAISDCQNAGFNNISVDLIYGLPNSSIKSWEYNLEKVKQLNIQHLSAYHLTFEKNTVFDVKRIKGELFPVKEDDSLAQFRALIKWAKKNEFIHYEISNFGKENFFSKHNTNYWRQQKYLGIGPSAHSYNSHTRCWNTSNLSSYINKIKHGETAFETETLTDIDKHNEYLITLLRTRWGINMNDFELQFGTKQKTELLNKAQYFIQQGDLFIKDNKLLVSDKGLFICDAILTELMLINDNENTND